MKNIPTFPLNCNAVICTLLAFILSLGKSEICPTILLIFAATNYTIASYIDIYNKEIENKNENTK